MLPLLNAGGPEAAPAEVMSEVEHRPLCWARALQRDGYKLILSRQDGVEHVALYDLASDSGETRNLADDRPEIAAQLRKRLAELLAAAKKEQVESPELELDPTTEERLRALGYFE